LFTSSSFYTRAKAFVIYSMYVKDLEKENRTRVIAEDGMGAAVFGAYGLRGIPEGGCRVLIAAVRAGGTAGIRRMQEWEVGEMLGRRRTNESCTTEGERRETRVERAVRVFKSLFA